MILDTTFLIDLFRGKKDAVEKANKLDEKGEIILLTPISVFELFQGLDSKTKEKILDDFVNTFSSLSFDNDSAKIAGKISLDLESRGLKIDPEDVMIAGIAIRNDHSLLTRDSDYSRIKGLKLETY